MRDTSGEGVVARDFANRDITERDIVTPRDKPGERRRTDLGPTDAQAG